MDVQQPIFYSGGVVKKLLRCDVFKATPHEKMSHQRLNMI